VALLVCSAHVSLKPSHLISMVEDWALRSTELGMLCLFVRLHSISIVADLCTFYLQKKFDSNLLFYFCNPEEATLYTPVKLLESRVVR